MNAIDPEFSLFTAMCWSRYYNEDLISLYYLDKEEGVLVLPPPSAVIFYLIGLWKTINDSIGSYIDTHEAEDIHVDDLPRFKNIVIDYIDKLSNSEFESILAANHVHRRIFIVYLRAIVNFIDVSIKKRETVSIFL